MLIKFFRYSFIKTGILFLSFLYVIGNIILKLGCNLFGIMIPIFIVSLIYLIIKKLWISVFILLGILLCCLALLFLISVLLAYIGNWRNKL